MNIISFDFCSKLWCLFKQDNYLETSASSLGISNSIAKILFFPYSFFIFYFLYIYIYIFLKKGIFMSNLPQYCFLCFIRHQYHFATNTYFSMISNPSIQRHPLVFLKKGSLNFWNFIIVGLIKKLLLNFLRNFQ